MTERGIARILLDESPGETRAVAVDFDGAAWHAFVHRPVTSTLTTYGARVSAHVRSLAPEQGGAFARLGSGEDVFIRIQGNPAFAEGAKVELRIEAEARNGKLARAITVDAQVPVVAPFDAWRDQLPGGADLPIDADRDGVDIVFEGFSAQATGLPRGGQIWVERNRALTAIDIDTAGRLSRGRPHARAHAINREAVEAAIRQMSLRRLGGIFVIDCVAPVSRESGTQLRSLMSELVDRYTSLSLRSEGPTQKLGLLSGALNWRFRPIEEVLFNGDGEERPETELLSALRLAVREARADRGSFFTLHLGAEALALYVAEHEALSAALPEDVQGRVRISDQMSDCTEIRRA